MQRRSFRSIALLIVLSAVSLASAAFDATELRGFRTAAWGSSVDTLGPSHLVFSSGAVSCYRRELENMLYGESPVKDIQYCYYQDQLFLVAMDTAVDLDTLMQREVASSGAPDWSVPGKATWGDRSTRARVEVTAPQRGSASMLMYSNQFEPRAKLLAKAQ